MKEITFGIIGPGNIARNFAEACNYLKYRIVGVASRNLAKAEAFKDKYHIDVAYNNYQQLVDDSNIDCIYIATPASLHYEHILLSLRAKKHVICEKPMCLNENQAKEVFKLAKKNNCFIMEALWTKFLPLTQLINSDFISNKIGTIRNMDISFTFNAQRDPNSRLFNPKLGGGALLDLGIYPILYSNLLFGKPHSIFVSDLNIYNQVDVHSLITYQYKNTQTNFLISFEREENVAARINGDNGFVEIPNFVGAQVLNIYNKKSELLEIIHRPFECNGFEYQIRHVYESIINGKLESNVMSHKDTTTYLSQMDIIRKKMNLRYPNE